MRSQLLRRTTDLKKNIGGASRYLDVLRELTSAASEQKMFTLNENLNINTNKLIELNESNEKGAACLYLIVLCSVAGGVGHARSVHGRLDLVNAAWM